MRTSCCALTMLAGLLACGCATSPASGDGTGPTPGLGSALNGVLPPLSSLKGASIPFSDEVLGKYYYDCSANVILDGTALVLLSPAHGISWGIWQLDPAARQPVAVEAVLSLPAGDHAYLGLADYAAGVWRFEGPLSEGTIVSLDESHLSPDGYCYVAVIAADGSTATVHKHVLATESPWLASTVDSAGNVGSYSSLAVISGVPAIGYCESLAAGNRNALKYVRASDPEGDAWETPLVLDEYYDEYAFASLKVVNGRPAIAFYTYLDVDIIGGSTLFYIRATEAWGDSWGSPLAVDGDGVMMVDGGFGRYCSLAVVDGVPAVSYRGSALLELRYRQALDPNGGSWDTPKVVHTSSEGLAYTSLIAVDGLPFICFYDFAATSLRGVGTSMDGTTWNPAINIDAGLGDTGAYASAALVAFEAAAAYYSFRVIFGGQLKYVRYNIQNSEWEQQVVTGSGSPGKHCSLAVIAGNPAISYYDEETGDLKYVRALDAQGSSWGTPETVDSLGNVGTYTSLAEVDGKAAISYYDEGNKDLKFAIRLGP